MRDLPAGAIAALSVILVLVGAAGAVEVFFAPAPRNLETTVGQEPVPAGTWYCPVTAGEGQESRVTVAAVGDEPSTVVVMRYKDAKVVDDPPVDVAIGQPLEIPLAAGEASEPIAVRWQGGPSVVHWRVEGGGQGGNGDSAAAACEPGPSQAWHFAGFDTTIRTKSTLHLFNPYGEDAVARLRFSTPEGPVDLVIADNLLVQAGTGTQIDLSEFQPEEPDLGVTVDVLSGRLVGQGQVAVDGGSAGRAVLRGVAAPGLQWAVAEVRSGETSAAWLSVQNPSDRDAAIEVQVSNPSTVQTALLGETSIPAGGVARIDLDGASAEPSFGLAVTSVNETPVVVSVSWTLRTSEGRGLAMSLAAPQSSTEWALPGGSTTADRSAEVSIYNPGAEDATVTVLSPDGPVPEWSDLSIGPNERVTVDLATAGENLPAVPVRVKSDRPVVTELRSLDTSSAPRLWTNVGIPAIDWAGPPTRPTVRLDPTLQTTPTTGP